MPGSSAAVAAVVQSGASAGALMAGGQGATTGPGVGALAVAGRVVDGNQQQQEQQQQQQQVG